ncbi:MAG: hypothetical protein OEY56_08190 [Cyclobacteriaceae bacterium]|nr:hypothetical protein [Cyclobacteriaceae bacterium]
MIKGPSSPSPAPGGAASFPLSDEGVGRMERYSGARVAPLLKGLSRPLPAYMSGGNGSDLLSLQDKNGYLGSKN